jgi:hypothetical protein
MIAGDSPWPVAGRSSPTITLGYYAHFVPEAGSQGRTAIDGLPGGGEVSMPVRTPQRATMENKGEQAGWLREC